MISRGFGKNNNIIARGFGGNVVIQIITKLINPIYMMTKRTMINVSEKLKRVKL